MAAGMILVVACTAPIEEPAEPTVLGSVALLTRASLDLRGVRPTAVDVQAVLADPAAADALVDGYVDDERFGHRVRSLFAPAYLTRADEADLAEAEYALPDESAFLVAMGEEPLRILGEIANHDLPYTDIVRADWTMIDHELATRYPTDYPEGGWGWQRVSYTDGRPRAGILSTNGFWWRYTTTTGNANRGRANAVSRVLLCQDYLDRTIEVDPELDLLDEDAVRDALRYNEACVACHYSLDPMGAYLWGFYVEFTQNLTDLSFYHPEREYLWQEYGTGVAPGYYGTPGDDLEDLSRQIAADPRLVQCMVERSREVLLQRAATIEETDVLTRHREDFLAGNTTIRSLFRSLVRHTDYRRAPGQGDDEAVAWKLVSSDQYVSQLEALTGFRFVSDGKDVMNYDSFGLRTLAGGGRAVYGTTAAVEPTPTMAVVQQRLAEAAAHAVVEADRADPESAELFVHIDFTETPTAGRDAIVEQLRWLFLRAHGKDHGAESDEVAGALALWEELHALQGDPAAAWAGVLTAILRHPDFLVY